MKLAQAWAVGPGGLEGMLFKKRRDKVRHCRNNHLQDPSWDSCPYCEGESDASGDFIPADDELGPPSTGPRPRAPAPPPPYVPPLPYVSPAPPAPAPAPYQRAPEPVRRIVHPPLPRPVPAPIRREPVAPPGFNAPGGGDDITVIGPRPSVAAPPPVYVPPRQAAPPAYAPPEPPVNPVFAGEPMDSDKTAVLRMPVGRQESVAWLVAVSGAHRGRDFRLTGGTLRFGTTQGCDVVIADDRFLSGGHAEVVFEGGQYVLRDLNSTNGTLVNDIRIAEQALRDGDRVQMGSTRFLFKCFTLPAAT